MGEYIVLFFSSGEVKLTPNSFPTEYQNNELKRVNKEEMFQWLQVAHSENIPLSIYEATLKLDLS